MDFSLINCRDRMRVTTHDLSIYRMFFRKQKKIIFLKTIYYNNMMTVCQVLCIKPQTDATIFLIFGVSETCIALLESTGIIHILMIRRWVVYL